MLSDMANRLLNAIKGHPDVTGKTAYAILFTMGVCHLLNDMIQSVIPALYPLLKDKFGFTFAQIGIITLVFQLASSVFQPFIGNYSDKHPQPYSLACGMCFTLAGLLALAFAPNYGLILLSVALIGCGSSVFHPEASRVAQLASGGKKSLAQSIFQVGGNGGSAFGTLLGGFLGDRYGRKYVILFSILGAAPFTLAMPYLNLGWTMAAAVMSGLIIASAFSAIVVYATDLKPDKVGMMSGVFFGLMFGLGGIGSAFFGWLADLTSIAFIFNVSTLLPLLGVVAVFLPDIRNTRIKLTKSL